MVTKGFFIFITIILLVIFITVVIWVITSAIRLYSKDIEQNQGAYCIDSVCTTGSKVLYKLDSNTYETVNYCTVNSAPSSFIHALQACTVPAEQVKSFAEFYDTKYLDTCGISWMNEPTNSSGEPVDLLAMALVACANKLSLGDNANIKSIAKKVKVT